MKIKYHDKFVILRRLIMCIKKYCFATTYCQRNYWYLTITRDLDRCKIDTCAFSWLTINYKATIKLGWARLDVFWSRLCSANITYNILFFKFFSFTSLMKFKISMAHFESRIMLHLSRTHVFFVKHIIIYKESFFFIKNLQDHTLYSYQNVTQFVMGNN